jgi:succinate-acetate transporter protein
MSTVFEEVLTRQVGNVELPTEPAARARRGHPYELGMIGFAFAAFVYGAFYAQWVPASVQIGTLSAGLILGGLLPLIAGVLLFTTIRGESELATAFSLLGAYFLYDLAANRFFAIAGVGGVDLATFMGMTFVAWAVVMAYMTISLWARHPGAAIVTGCFALSLVALGIGQWAAITGWTIVGGYGFMVVAVLGLAMATLRRFPKLVGE